MKNNLEFALHDSSLNIDVNKFLETGKVYFNKTAAASQFDSSLKYNFKLKDSKKQVDYDPQQGNFFKHPMKVLMIDYVDDSVPYPRIYTNAIYGINQTLYGPSALALIETKSSLPFIGKERTIRRFAVYEYKK
ncbi:hypothetical protein LCY76_22825 [Fictibacillus sp. KIGAM418]|uniref:Uncharacterized protein n=1 Tax=Fictibacillus marinisediminis TaxID=2878389 RepID=A0A9X1XI75_9BACL|nr:hypothetical protein [Fictibacillus marinisediminis]MCK6259410.1 hypothetical protein [Fictibacillus marinisediminis]